MKRSTRRRGEREEVEHPAQSRREWDSNPAREEGQQPRRRTGHGGRSWLPQVRPLGKTACRSLGRKRLAGQLAMSVQVPFGDGQAIYFTHVRMPVDVSQAVFFIWGPPALLLTPHFPNKAVLCESRCLNVEEEKAGF